MDKECATQGGHQCKFTRIRSNGMCVSSHCMKQPANNFTYTGNPSRVGMHISMYKSHAT